MSARVRSCRMRIRRRLSRIWIRPGATAPRDDPRREHPRRCPGVIAFFLLAVTSMTLLGPALAGPTSSEAVGSGVLKLWSPASTGMVSSLTGTRAVQIAKDFDLILASPKTFAPYTASMHAANPKLVVLGRINGTFAGRTQGGTYPASWYLYDGAGNKVRSLRYGTYMMDDSVQGWIDSRTKLCASVADGSHYDGCYLDSLGSSPIGPGYVTGAPINPSTNKPWTYTEWLAVTTTLASKVRTAVAPRTVEANGLTDGPRYFQPIEARVLFNAMDAVIAEGFLRNGRAPLSRFRARAIGSRTSTCSRMRRPVGRPSLR
jgi:hypothetical protein